MVLAVARLAEGNSTIQMADPLKVNVSTVHSSRLATGSAGLLAPSLPLAGAIGSFMLANAAFAIGVVKALTGRAPGSFDKS